MAKVSEPKTDKRKRGPATGRWDDSGSTFYSRADAIRDGRPMTYLAKGKMRRTVTA